MNAQNVQNVLNHESPEIATLRRLDKLESEQTRELFDSPRTPHIVQFPTVLAVSGRAVDPLARHLATLDKWLEAAVDSAESEHDVVISW